MHKWKSYHVLFLRYGVWQTEFFSLWTIFCPSTPLTTWKITILMKWKKNNSSRCYHFIHVYHKWKPDDVFFLRYKAWKTKRFVILGNLDNPPKIKNLKKKNKNLEISSFETREPKIMIIRYTVPEIQRMADVILYFCFELLFALLKHLEILSFYPCVPKIRIRWCMVPEILAWRMNGWRLMDGWMDGWRSDI